MPLVRAPEAPATALEGLRAGGRRRHPRDARRQAASVRLELPDNVMLYMFAIILAALQGRGPGSWRRRCRCRVRLLLHRPALHVASTTSRHVMTFAVMFTIGTALGGLVARLRYAETASLHRERRTAALLAFTSELPPRDRCRRRRHRGRRARRGRARRAPRSCSARARRHASAAPAGLQPLAENEMAVARWAHEHRRPAGRGTETLPASAACSRCRCGSQRGRRRGRGADRTRAPAADRARRPPPARSDRPPGRRRDRAPRARRRGPRGRAPHAAEELPQLAASTVSHDLRTPLAIITGTATGLRDEGRASRGQARALDTITGGAPPDKILRTCSRSRGSAGAQMRREWVPVEDWSAPRSTAQRGRARRPRRHDRAAPRARRARSIRSSPSSSCSTCSRTPASTRPGHADRVRGHREGAAASARGLRPRSGLPTAHADQVFAKFFRGPEAPPHAPPAPASASRSRAESSLAHSGRIEARPRRWRRGDVPGLAARRRCARGPVRSGVAGHSDVTAALEREQALTHVFGMVGYVAEGLP